MPANHRKPLRVLLVDDHQVVREGLKVCLRRAPGLKVVGEAADGRTALEEARRLTPDLVVMDLNLPGRGGLETTELLRRELPQVAVLVLTMHEEPQYVVQVVRAGAGGYVPKSAPPAELIEAVRRVGAGGHYYNGEAAQIFLRAHLGGPSPSSRPRAPSLSSRELEVLKGIAHGLSNKEIAVQLAVGTRTVETHRERLMRKLDLHTVAGLTRYAIAQGLVGME